MVGIQKLSPAETVFDIKAAPGVSRGCPVLRPMKKHISLMDFTIRKFTNGGDIVRDPFIGTGATAMHFLREPSDRKFTGCDANNERVVNKVPSVLHVFVECGETPSVGCKC